jgi:hypothetical protein
MAIFANWFYEQTGIELLKIVQAFFVNTSKELSTSKVFVNIKYRLDVDAPLPDNGFLAMYYDTGWPGLIAWFIFWMVIIREGLKSCRIESGINTVYAIAAIVTLLFSALLIRTFQVYPVWVMGAIILGVSLAWFHYVIAHKDFSEDS